MLFFSLALVEVGVTGALHVPLCFGEKLVLDENLRDSPAPFLIGFVVNVGIPKSVNISENVDVQFHPIAEGYTPLGGLRFGFGDINHSGTVTFCHFENSLERRDSSGTNTV